MEARNKRILVTIIIVSSVLLVIIGGVLGANYINDMQRTNQPTPAPAPPQTPTPTPVPDTGVSPLIFGTNLGLFNENDQLLWSEDTRELIPQLHVQMIRMPMRKDVPEATEIRMANYIKEMGATPLIILHGADDDPEVDELAENKRFIEIMNQVFGKEIVYYEFGNENDLFDGIQGEEYVTQWNKLMPALKSLPLNGKFIGPVNFEYNGKYLRTFLERANPRPDLISWHSYTCSYKEPAAECLSSIDTWADDFADARKVMQETIGSELPIIISEWNYAPDQSIQPNGKPFTDNKYDNEAFVKEWTTKALKSFADNRIFASMQYSVTNTALPLINNDVEITTQGKTFQSLYTELVKKK